mmetsp:Transcript_22860/g.29817  ORF Transcript_22860/g.29817 Transcript_22860/m.29817 type:complete len:82 (-) Transcript_22860:137-382(-)
MTSDDAEKHNDKFIINERNVVDISLFPFHHSIGRTIYPVLNIYNCRVYTNDMLKFIIVYSAIHNKKEKKKFCSVLWKNWKN